MSQLEYQQQIRHLAENLLSALDTLVPAEAPPIVEDSRRTLKDLVAQVDSLPTVEPTTWTFFGHWRGDRIVVDYVLPGALQDDRQDDSGQYPEGLWADSASGATVEEAQAAALSEYEDQHDEDHDRT